MIKWWKSLAGIDRLGIQTIAMLIIAFSLIIGVALYAEQKETSMVRVIKKEPDKSVVKEAICQNCGATLEYVPKDVKEYNGTDYSGGSDGHKFIKCPQCKAKVILQSW